jgi:hypothetical protein
LSLTTTLARRIVKDLALTNNINKLSEYALLNIDVGVIEKKWRPGKWKIAIIGLPRKGQGGEQISGTIDNFVKDVKVK